MIIFPCHVCQTALSVEDGQAAQLVRCPRCATTLRAPLQEQLAAIEVAAPAISPTAPSPVAVAPRLVVKTPVGVPYMSRSTRRYGFSCGYCSSRLEATDAMAAQEGQCPTCGNSITIPILDRFGRLIDPKTRQIIKQDPHPVHAYAAAGERAPRILRAEDGHQNIQCARCGGLNLISANNCKNCGMPFTMEGTTLEAAGTSNGFCVASLVLGIVSLPLSCIIVPALLAILFGIIGVTQTNRNGGTGKGLAIAGIICGTLGAFIGITLFANGRF